MISFFFSRIFPYALLYSRNTWRASGKHIFRTGYFILETLRRKLVVVGSFTFAETRFENIDHRSIY